MEPIGYVPVLVDEDIVLSDSFAILVYLEEKYPQHPLLPRDLQRRGINYQAANIVSSSIQPLQNIGVLKYIGEKVHPDEKLVWVQYHIGKGFAAFEKLLKDYAGKYATGDEVCLQPCGVMVLLVYMLIMINGQMFLGTQYLQQSYKVSESFPFKWINKKWREGFYVTAIATAGSRWAIVMSRGAGFSDQVQL